MNEPGGFCGGRTAVAVHGDSDRRRRLAEVLRAAELEASTFATAEEALGALDPGSPPALVLVQTELPDLDGRQFCRLLRSPEFGLLPEVPVLLVQDGLVGKASKSLSSHVGASGILSLAAGDESLRERIKATVAARPESGRPRALVVAAEEEQERMRLAFLEQEGYDVARAASPAAARAALAGVAYDLAVLDHDLPGEPADALLDCLRAEQPSCVCLVIAARPAAAECLDWMRRGAADCLRKPADACRLLAVHRRIRLERSCCPSHCVAGEIARLGLGAEGYRFLVELAKDGVWAMDADHRTTYVNRAMADMLGYAPEAMVGTTVESFFFQEDMQIHAERMAARHAGKSETYERRFRHRDGSAVWTLASAHALLDEQGQFAGSFAMFTDITERKRGESVMRARLRLLDQAPSLDLTELLRATLDEAEALTGSRIGFYHFVDWDQTALTLQTWSTRTMAAHCRIDAAGQHYPVAHAGVWVDCIRERRPVIHNDYESLPHRKGMPPGHAAVVRELVVPVFRDDRIVAVLGVGNKPTDYDERDIEAVAALADLGWDIAESKRSQEALRGSEANFRAFFESMGEMVLVATREGSILATNGTLRTTLGYPPEALLGTHVCDLHPPDLREKARGIFADILAGRREICPLPLAAADGRLVPVEIRCWFGTWSGEPCLFAVAKNQSTVLEARRNFRRLFLASPIPMALSSATEGTFLDVNAAWLHVTGYARKEVIGRGPTELGLFANPAEVVPVREQLRATGTLREAELQVVCKDGTVRDGLFFGETISNQGEDCFLTLMVDITERKRGQERLRSIFRAAPVGIGMVRDRVLCEVNERICEMIGYDREELLGQSSRILYPSQEEFVFVSREKYTQIAATGRGEVVTRWQRKDGSALDVLLASVPICPEDLSRGVTFTALDITDQRRAEEDLRISRERLRLFIDASPDLYFLKDRDLRYLLLNRANAAFFGRPEQEILGRTDAELMPPEVAAGCTAGDRQAMAENQVVVSVEEAGGRFYEARKIPVVADGEITGVAGLVRDITEMRAAEQALRQFKTIFDTASFGIATTTMDGILDYVNPSFAAAHGYAPEEIQGRPLAVLLASGEAGARALLATLASDGAFAAREETHCRRDGSRFTMLVAGCLIRQEDGSAESVALTAVDISERKLLEAQLQHTQRMESVGRLAGGVAHDFNNMLGAILGYTELALDQVDPSLPLHGDLQEVYQAAERSSELTRQLLTFARKQEVVPQLLDLNSAIGSMLKMLAKMVGEDIELAWQPGPEVGRVRMDPVQLDQILANLCVNARDAIAGVGTIAIRTRNVVADRAYCARFLDAAPGNYVAIQVDDTGTGMTKDTLEHLFEPFFTTKAEGVGTGLGLATVYGIVKQNEGFIQVESTLGAGSSFTIHLPRHEDRCLAAHAPADRSALPRGSETILLVEDEELFLRMVVSMLRHAGYEVVTANSPWEAIELARGNPGRFDLLLTDVIMPGMPGRELATEIKAMQPRAKCLFMSGYGATVVERQGLPGSDRHFIQKPFTAHELATKVRGVLDGG